MDWSDDSNEIHEQAIRNWNGDVMFTNRISVGSITTDRIDVTDTSYVFNPKTDLEITSQTHKHTNAKRSPKRKDGEGKAVGHTWSIGSNLDYEWDGYEWLYRRKPRAFELNRWEDEDQRQRRLLQEQKNAFYAYKESFYDYDDDPITFADSSIMRPPPTAAQVARRKQVVKGTITDDHDPYKDESVKARDYPNGTCWDQVEEERVIATWYADGEEWQKIYQYYPDNVAPIEKFAKDTYKTQTTLEEILEHSEVEFHDYDPRQYYLNLLNQPKK